MTGTDNDVERAKDKAKAEPWPGMSIAEFEFCERFIEEGKAKLGIIDHQVLLSTMPIIDDSNYAQIAQRVDKLEWLIQLNARWSTFTIKVRRLTLTHELCHVLVGAYADVTENLVKHHVSSAASGFVRGRLLTEEETLVNRLARAMLPLMPEYPDSFDPVESKDD